MNELVERLQIYRDNAYRNVVKVAEDFANIATNAAEQNAINIALRLIGKTETTNPDNDFYYTTAIGFPFLNYAASRFSDGSFPVWYGSVDADTTIYETAYHMLLNERNVEHTSNEIIYRDRIIYTVICDAVLVDITSKLKKFPELTSDHYQFTQTVGKFIQTRGMQGILSKSARHDGINLNIFKQSTLTSPKPITELTYALDLNSNQVTVHFRDQHQDLTITYS